MILNYTILTILYCRESPHSKGNPHTAKGVPTQQWECPHSKGGCPHSKGDSHTAKGVTTKQRESPHRKG